MGEVHAIVSIGAKGIVRGVILITGVFFFDTTAAVVGAGAVHSEAAMKVASIVKMSQNALIGVVAFLLALYWVVRVEKRAGQRPNLLDIWRRFPKFVLGFALVSVVACLGFVKSIPW